MKNYFATSALASIAKILADKYKLEVIFKGSVPCTDGKSITLPAVSDELSIEGQHDLLAYTVHEVGHILFTDFKYSWEFQKIHGETAFALLNALEDTRIERLMELDYAGAERLLKESYNRLKCSFETQAPPNALQQFISLLYVIGREYTIPIHWDKNLITRARKYEKEISQASKARRTREVADIALHILTDIKDLIPNEPPDKALITSNKSTNEPGKMFGSSHIQKGKAEKNQSTDTHSIKEGAHSGISGIKGIREVIRDRISQSCDTLLSTNINQAFRRYDATVDTYRTPLKASPLMLFEAEAMIQPYVRAVRPKLISAFIAIGKTRWLGSQRSGAIDVSKLPDLMTGATEKVFKKRVEGKCKKTVVTLLVDASGSMRGARIQIANAVSLLFADTLYRAQITCRVVYFSGSRTLQPGISKETYTELRKQYSHIAPVNYSVVKDFLQPYRKVKSRFPSIKAVGGTPLAPALLQEVKLLLNRNEDRKILMSITDGEPNGDGFLSAHEHVAMCKEMLIQADRLGVESVGIGISVDVGKVFKRSVRVDTLQDLPKTTIKELHKLLIKGNHNEL